MLTNYQNNNQKIYLDDIEEYLRFIAEILLKPSRYLINKLNSINLNNQNSQLNHETFLKKYNQLQNEFNENKINLYGELDVLADSLKKNDFFYDEYFDFCEINDIIKYTLDKDFSLIEDSDFDFIMGIMENFSKLINYKNQLIISDNFDKNKFELKYSEYLSDFNNSKKYFYENKCDGSVGGDVFAEYTNIIIG